jgi:hypothetical protein
MKNVCHISTRSLLWVSFVFFPAPLFSQNINVSTPLQSVNDSYYENFGVNFGFSIRGGRGNGSRVVGLSPSGQLTPNLAFSQNLAGSVPFGGAAGNGGGQLNIGSRGSGGGFSLGLNMAQGNSRSSVTTVPSLTVQNGFGGSIASGEFRPFATGFVPVVSGGQYQRPIDNAVTRAINSGELDSIASVQDTDSRPHTESRQIYSDPNSTATRGDASVASIKAARQRQLAANQRRLKNKLSEAQDLLDRQEIVEARIKFREALQLTQDKNVKQEIKARIAEMRKR